MAFRAVEPPDDELEDDVGDTTPFPGYVKSVHFAERKNLNSSKYPDFEAEEDYDDGGDDDDKYDNDVHVVHDGNINNMPYYPH